MMRRIWRHARTALCALSLLLSIGVCALWWRARGVMDQVSWNYHRWLPDGSAAGDGVHLTSDKRRLSFLVMRGRVGPPNGQLVWGYYINAEQSGGKPRWNFHSFDYDPLMEMLHRQGVDPLNGYAGWGPVRWQTSQRTVAKDGHDSWSFELALSPWLVALLLLVPPAMWVIKRVKTRRLRKTGRCVNCRYDLRATPNRCPECGAAAIRTSTAS
jgi:hypothetical protein